MQIRKKVAMLAVLGMFLVYPHISLAYGCYSQGTYYTEGYYQSSYYSQGYYQSTYYTQGSYQTTITVPTTVVGTFSVTSNISKLGGSFVIDHPLDPTNKLLYHSFVESPDVKNVYDGIVVLDQSGEAIVPLPSYFEALNKDFRYQIKPVGASMPDLYIKNGVQNNQFVIGGGKPGGHVSWQVTGTRHDAYILANPIIVETQKGPTALVPKGEYLFPAGYTNSAPIVWGSVFNTLSVIVILCVLLWLLRKGISAFRSRS
jgi:hypothetical protein